MQNRVICFGSVGRAEASNTRGPHSSNTVIGKLYIEHLFTVSCIEKTKIKKNFELKFALATY